VLLRVLPLLVLSVFVDPDNEACEFIGDPKPSVISMRHKRSFSETIKIANFSSNYYYYYYSSISACSPRAGTDNIHICASL
jgi:hypothetical protein